MKLEIKFIKEKDVDIGTYFAYFAALVFIQSLLLAVIFININIFLAGGFVISTYVYFIISSYLSRIKITKLKERR